MLSGTAHCGPCRRAGVDQCFVSQANPACTHCMSLCNPHGQCTVEPLIITALTSERSGVVVLVRSMTAFRRCLLSGAR